MVFGLCEEVDQGRKSRKHELGVEIEEGAEDESTFPEPGMRHAQARVRREVVLEEGIRGVSIGDKVQIDFPWGVTLGGTTPDARFDRLEGGEQGSRRKVGLGEDDAIEERRLAYHVHGLGFIGGADANGTQQGPQFIDRLHDMTNAVPDVRAVADGDADHGGTLAPSGHRLLAADALDEGMPSALCLPDRVGMIAS